MNSKNIFPEEFIDNSYDSIVAEMNTTSKSIYYCILLILIVILTASTFVSVEIGVTSIGTIKTKEEHVVINSPIDGYLKPYVKQNGVHVNKDDTLFVVWSDNFEVTLPSLNERKKEIEEQLQDLQTLTANNTSPRLRTKKYQHDYKQFCFEIEKLKENVEMSKKNYERSTVLYEKGFISTNEHEENKRIYTQYNSEINSFRASRLLQWDVEKYNITEEIRDIENKINTINNQISEAIVLSPVAASVHYISTEADGLYVHNNQQLIELSPDGQLLAECLIGTKDIGLIKEGMNARIRIDAYDYTQWGVINGSILRISPDVFTTESGTYYRVECTLSKDYLELKNGVKGYIKKGMGLTARIVVTERTVFQLIQDKMDDWLNPTVIHVDR